MADRRLSCRRGRDPRLASQTLAHKVHLPARLAIVDAPVAIPMNLPLSTLPKRSRFYLPGRASFHLINASLEDEEHCGRRKRNDSLPSSVSRAQVHELRCEIPGSVARVTAHQGRILPDIAACLQVGYRVDTEVRSNPSAVFE